MVIGVVAHDVALLGHAPDDVRSGLHHVPHHEEGGGSVVLFQGVQDLLRIAVLIAAVEGEVDDLVAGIAQEPGVMLRQLLRRGVAHGGLALVGEGEPPVVRRGGDDGGGGSGDGLPLQIEHRRQEEAGERQDERAADTLKHKAPP